MHSLLTIYSEEANFYHNRNRYGLEIYQYATQRYLTLLSTFTHRMTYHEGRDTAYLIHTYRDAVEEAVKFTDSLKTVKALMLLEADKQSLLFQSRENLKLISGNVDYDLLRLIYEHDFLTQITKAISIVHPNYGCLKIVPYSFQDFMIIQNHDIGKKTYYISVQNNFLLREGHEEHYHISFKALEKIHEKDTVPLDAAIAFGEKGKMYKTSPIPYEKGNYLLTLNLNYKLPSGIIKVHEMTFEYELK